MYARRIHRRADCNGGDFSRGSRRLPDGYPGANDAQARRVGRSPLPRARPPRRMRVNESLHHRATGQELTLTLSSSEPPRAGPRLQRRARAAAGDALEASASPTPYNASDRSVIRPIFQPTPHLKRIGADSRCVRRGCTLVFISATESVGPLTMLGPGVIGLPARFAATRRR